MALTVIADLGVQDFGTYRKRMLKCRCACGVEIEILANNLTKQNACKPCGHLQAAAATVTHGRSHDRLWNTHHGMLQRCSNPNAHGYEHYGGKGITVCARWQGRQGLSNFIADMGEPPSPGHSIDRRKGHLGYSKGNCRWATRSEQSRNTTQNRLITRGKVTKTLIEWAEMTGVPERLLRSRLAQGITDNARLFSKEDLRKYAVHKRNLKGKFA